MPTIAKRGAAATLVALLIGAVGATIAAAPASAAIVDVNTSTVVWTDINDLTGYVDDGYFYDPAHDVEGWNGDPFDGVPQQFVLSYGGTDWGFTADTTVPTIVPGGASAFVLTGNTGATFTPEFTVVLTLTLEGNYARWTYDVTDTSAVVDPAAITLLQQSFIGDSGADSNTDWTVTGNGVTSNDTGFGDPIVGMFATTNGVFGGWDVIDNDGGFEASSIGGSQFSVTMAMVGWDPCGFNEAVNFMASAVNTLPATYGAAYDTFSSCLTIAPATVEAKKAVSQVLPFTYDAILDSYSYFDGSSDLNLAVSGLPAGLTATVAQQPDGSAVITLSGTATQAGSFTPTFLLYLTNDPANPGFLPLTSSFALTVNPAALPDTGVDAGTTVLIAGGSSALGIAMLAFAALRRRAIV